MTYADLTDDQKSTLDDFVQVVRRWCMEQAKAGALASSANDNYNNSVVAILGELVDGDEIPNRSGLSGSESLTKAELVTLVSYLQGVDTNYNTAGHRSNMAKGCGLQNTLRG